MRNIDWVETGCRRSFSTSFSKLSTGRISVRKNPPINLSWNLWSIVKGSTILKRRNLSIHQKTKRIARCGRISTLLATPIKKMWRNRSFNWLLPWKTLLQQTTETVAHRRIWSHRMKVPAKFHKKKPLQTTTKLRQWCMLKTTIRFSRTLHTQPAIINTTQTRTSPHSHSWETLRHLD